MYFEDEFTKDKFDFFIDNVLKNKKTTLHLEFGKKDLYLTFYLCDDCKICEDLDEAIQSYKYNEPKYKGLKNELKQISLFKGSE